MAQFYFSFGKKPDTEKQTIIQAAVLWSALEPLIGWVLQLFNTKILPGVEAETLKIIFDELDIFWLRNATFKHYEDNQIRIIIAMMIRAAENKEFTRQELLSIVDYIQRKWVPQEALKKIFTQTDEVIEARVVATIDEAIELYEKKYEERPLTPEEFVASTAQIIYHKPDGSLAQDLLGGELQIKNKLFY